MCGLSAFTFGWFTTCRGAVVVVVDDPAAGAAGAVVVVVDDPAAGAAGAVVVVVVGPDCATGATGATAATAGRADQIVTAVAVTASRDHQRLARTRTATRARPAYDRLILMPSPEDARWSPGTVTVPAPTRC
jgi:hypothetical protein